MYYMYRKQAQEQNNVVEILNILIVHFIRIKTSLNVNNDNYIIIVKDGVLYDKRIKESIYI